MEWPDVLTEAQAAEYLHCSASLLRLWRTQRKGPDHIRMGERLVRYRRADLDAYIQAHLKSNPGNQSHPERNPA